IRRRRLVAIRVKKCTCRERRLPVKGCIDDNNLTRYPAKVIALRKNAVYYCLFTAIDTGIESLPNPLR
ncbi:MAG TPA: hypothetical protein VHK70_09165, partial [Burkholderiaceae bacterium]|nr:hypothetical protein [Burkholderiaceae bacterium]